MRNASCLSLGWAHLPPDTGNCRCVLPVPDFAYVRAVPMLNDVTQATNVHRLSRLVRDWMAASRATSQCV